MKNLPLIGLTLMYFSLASIGQSTPINTKGGTEDGWTLFHEADYSIQYPDSWELDQSGQMGMRFIILSPLTPPHDLLRENINLLIQDLLGQNIDLNKFVEISEEQIKTLITNGNLLESVRLKANEREFHKVVYTGETGNYKLKFVQYYWIKDGKAYVLTFTCERDHYENFKEVGEKILNSFQWN